MSVYTVIPDTPTKVDVPDTPTKDAIPGHTDDRFHHRAILHDIILLTSTVHSFITYYVVCSSTYHLFKRVGSMFPSYTIKVSCSNLYRLPDLTTTGGHSQPDVGNNTSKERAMSPHLKRPL